MWEEVNYSFQNFSCTVEVSEWISNFIPHFTNDVIIYPRWDLNQSMLVIGAAGHQDKTELSEWLCIMEYLWKMKSLNVLLIKLYIFFRNCPDYLNGSQCVYIWCHWLSFNSCKLTSSQCFALRDITDVSLAIPGAQNIYWHSRILLRSCTEHGRISMMA